ncbi:unnamed protein product [Lactuca saligna]|uniref:Flavin-containing monooxygenase n=1 Tax=Lactuca saligna TaxID=75948 RepID=A0AA35V8K1_LACSI|nr:unnamed protein product [Lactuca saligna]
MVNVQDKRIGPLYQHVFPPRLAPRLSFVGIPEKGFTFLTMELQSRWIAHVLSGKILLPSEDEMSSDVKHYYQEMKENGLLEYQTHSLAKKPQYLDWMYAQLGMVIEKQIKDIIEYFTHCYIMAGFDGYMDAFLQKYGI